MMQVRYKKHRICAVIFLAMILYFLLRKRRYNFRLEFDVARASPSAVWEYVADFSNMKRLNPTILDFTIDSESGNYHNWRYSAHYTETLYFIPFIKNKIKGDFTVRKDGDDYVIISHHTTCFLPLSLGCVLSDSEYRFRSSGSAGTTSCLDHVTYECPAVFNMFCEKEVTYQHHAIRDNLRKHFSNVSRMQ